MPARCLAGAMLLVILAACQEIPQDARKPFGDEGKKNAVASRQKVLLERTQVQDENYRFNQSR